MSEQSPMKSSDPAEVLRAVRSLDGAAHALKGAAYCRRLGIAWLAVHGHIKSVAELPNSGELLRPADAMLLLNSLEDDVKKLPRRPATHVRRKHPPSDAGLALDRSAQAERC
jgi:hypothetical protein